MGTYISNQVKMHAYHLNFETLDNEFCKFHKRNLWWDPLNVRPPWNGKDWNCLKRHRFIYYSPKKERPKRCRFERYYGSSPSPRHAKQGKKKIFSSSVLTDFPSQKDADSPLKRHRHNPHFPRVGRAVEGRQHSGRPTMSLQKQGRRKKKRQKREKTEERGQRR